MQPVQRWMLSVILVVLMGAVVAQEAPPGPAASINWDDRMRELSQRRFNSSSYQLGPGDLIEVSAFGVESLTRVLRVDDGGRINFPLIGALQVAGSTATDAESLIAAGLARLDLVPNAQVTVLIREYRSQPIFVLGAVEQPGQYQMTYPLRLIDSLVLAGGVREDVAGNQVVIQRFARDHEPQATVDSELLEFDLSALLSTADPEVNCELRAGDVIRVPERQLEVFYLLGDVGKPGVYELPPSGALLLTQALAHAGGPLRTAKADQGILVRYDAEGERRETAVDVMKILKGRDPDVQVKGNDVIFIPGSASKSIFFGMLGALPRTVSDTVSRAPTWRRRAD